MIPVTLNDMVCYYTALIKLENPTDKIKEVIEKLETEIHFVIINMKRVEFK